MSISKEPPEGSHGPAGARHAASATPAFAPVPPMPRLLIVDDEAPQLEALCSLLGEAGYDVQGRARPEAALELLNKQVFDVLLSDLLMPGMDGIELMRRAQNTDPDLVTVLMTGHGTMDSAVSAMRIGALDYVLKPFRLSAITPVLARAVDVRNLRVRNRELLEQVTRHAKKLETANRELDAFAARIAHDLRTPLSIMQSFARVVVDSGGGSLSERDRGHLMRIVDAGQRADRLIHHLLAFARLGEAPMRAELVPLGPLVEQAREVVCGMPENIGRSVRWEVEPLPDAIGDPDLLLQVFVNLLSNAMKYSRDRADASVSVGHDRAGTMTEVWVRDNGAGFDPEHHDRLFGPFQRLHRADEFEGTGMGLANVKRIVERHGGSVRASSTPGQGATFTVALPAAAHP